MVYSSFDMHLQRWDLTSMNVLLRRACSNAIALDKKLQCHAMAPRLLACLPVCLSDTYHAFYYS